MSFLLRSNRKSSNAEVSLPAMMMRSAQSNDFDRTRSSMIRGGSGGQSQTQIIRPMVQIQQKVSNQVQQISSVISMSEGKSDTFRFQTVFTEANDTNYSSFFAVVK
jgi:hypothetical protein